MRLPDIAGQLAQMPPLPPQGAPNLAKLSGMPDIYIAPPPVFAPPPGQAPPGRPASAPQYARTGGGGSYPTTKPSGGFLQLPTRWGGTHVTSGLGWGTKSAEDIMAAPGTRVGAPVGGTVVYFHPTGAQGGGSMQFRGDDGRLYWLGHIANGLRAGSRVKRGQQIALVSADHAAPHVHIDAR